MQPFLALSDTNLRGNHTGDKNDMLKTHNFLVILLSLLLINAELA